MTTSLINACDRECGNCKNLKERDNVGAGREYGTCIKLSVKRYVSDYCWRWEELKHVEEPAERHVPDDGRRSYPEVKRRHIEPRTNGDNRFTTPKQDDRWANKNVNYDDQ